MEKSVCRYFFYFLGMFILALGLTFNTKSGLGATAIISVSYSISEIWKLDFGNTTFCMYLVFILMQLFLHWKKYGFTAKDCFIKDLLQIPMGAVFTRFLNFFSTIIPVFAEAYAGTFWGSMNGRLLVLAAGVLCTGIGSALSIPMNLVVSTGDGIVKAVADYFEISTGLAKNIVDFGCVAFSAALGLLCTGSLAGVGIGTFASMIFVGRVIAGFDLLFKEKLLDLAGLK